MIIREQRTYKTLLENARIYADKTISKDDALVIDTQIQKLDFRFVLNDIEKLIICDYLIQDINYSVRYIDEEKFYKWLDWHEKEDVKSALDKLVSLTLLNLRITTDKNFYSLNHAIFNELGI